MAARAPFGKGPAPGGWKWWVATLLATRRGCLAIRGNEGRPRGRAARPTGAPIGLFPPFPSIADRGPLQQLLWHLLASTRGGFNRLRILRALLGEPMNACQLANQLGLDYRTVRHHLDILLENGILARPHGDAYGSRLVVSGLMRANLETLDFIEQRIHRLEGRSAPKRRPVPAATGGH